MHTCGAWKRGCAAWNGQLADRNLDRSSYGIVEQNGLWTDISLRERADTPGRGMSVSFSPWPTGADPLASQLRATRCTSGGEVRVGHLVVAPDRTGVISALSDLRKQGCSVRVLVLVSSVAYRRTIRGVEAMRKAGLHVGCVPGLHDKFISFDSRAGSSTSRRVVWTGSQNLYSGSLRVDDEEELRISTADATGRAVGENAAVYAAYRRHWSQLATLRVPCPAIATRTAAMREPS